MCMRVLRAGASASSTERPHYSQQASNSRWRSLHSSEELARPDRQRRSEFMVDVEWEFFAKEYRVTTFQLTRRM
jgi:hypothetical protein